MLVATDIAGRGLDVKDIDLVINFDVPATKMDYVAESARARSY